MTTACFEFKSYQRPNEINLASGFSFAENLINLRHLFLVSRLNVDTQRLQMCFLVLGGPHRPTCLEYFLPKSPFLRLYCKCEAWKSANPTLNHGPQVMLHEIASFWVSNPHRIQQEPINWLPSAVFMLTRAKDLTIATTLCLGISSKWTKWLLPVNFASYSWVCTDMPFQNRLYLQTRFAEQS